MTYSISKRWNIELDILIEEIGNSIFPHPLQFNQDIAFVRSSPGILEYHRTIYPDDNPDDNPEQGSVPGLIQSDQMTAR